MCHRMSPLRFSELQEALDELNRSGHARLPRRDLGDIVPDAYPGTQMPLFTLDEQGALQVSTLRWGFDAPPGARSRLVFNTRIETALSQARTGQGIWASPILHGRCLVPVRGFHESWTVAPPARGEQVRFSMPGRQAFLLAGVWQDDRFSVLTTAPNQSVAPFHTRMPLVLGPGESATWLGPDFAALQDRSGILLDAERQPQD